MNVYNSRREVCEFEMRVVRALKVCCFLVICNVLIVR